MVRIEQFPVETRYLYDRNRVLKDLWFPQVLSGDIGVSNMAAISSRESEEKSKFRRFSHVGFLLLVARYGCILSLRAEQHAVR